MRVAIPPGNVRGSRTGRPPGRERKPTSALGPDLPDAGPPAPVWPPHAHLHQIAHDYVDRLAALDPLAATTMGVPGHDAEVPDFSPTGADARAALDRDTLAALHTAPVGNDRDRLARDVMAERLSLSRELFDADEHLYDLNIIASPMQRLRGAFDLMPTETEADWQNIAARLQRVPEALADMQASLKAGLQRRRAAAARQVRAVAIQARTWAGTMPGQRAPSFFHTLIAPTGAQQSPVAGPLSQRLTRAADQAAAAYDAWAVYLQDDYLPHAGSRDGVGPDRYALRARVFTGLSLDLAETYDWGWQELRRIRTEMAQTAERIQPGASLADAVHLLDTDPARAIEARNPSAAGCRTSRIAPSPNSTRSTSISPRPCSASRP